MTGASEAGAPRTGAAGADRGGFPGSHQAIDRARRVLAGGVSSNVRLDERPIPLVLRSGEGAYVEDVDGRRYIDYVCGFGPSILGHNHPRVTRAIVEAASRGLIFGGQHPLEADVAERVCAAVPSVAAVRYTASGSEAAHLAMRLARAATNRPRIVRFEGHYHGWLDTVYLGPPPAHGPAEAQPGTRGQPAAALHDLLVVPWNDIGAFDAAVRGRAGEIAAVMMEPILCNAGVIAPRPGYLEHVRSWCAGVGAMLIFDEIATGFRVALGGAQALLGVTPDLTVLGKAVANGLPMSLVGGRRDVMDLLSAREVAHGGTYNGSPLVLAAARATLETLAEDRGAVYDRITRMGRSLMNGLRRAGEAARVPVLLQGPGPVFQMWITQASRIDDARSARRADAEAYARFAAGLLRRGVRTLPAGRWYLSAAHEPSHVEATLGAARDALAELPE